MGVMRRAFHAQWLRHTTPQRFLNYAANGDILTFSSGFCSDLRSLCAVDHPTSLLRDSVWFYWLVHYSLVAVLRRLKQVAAIT